MSDKNTYGSSPYNREELPSYKEATSRDQTKIPMAQLDRDPVDEFLIKTNKSGSSTSAGTAPSDYDTALRRYFWRSGLALTYTGLGLLLFGHIGGDISLAYAALIFGWVCFVMGYVGYVFIALRWHQVNNILEQLVDKSELLQYTENLKQSAPRIIWRLNCFHDETRIITVSGRVTSLMVKVSNWTGEQTFPYQRWEDVSAMFEGASLDCSDGYCAVTVSVECILSDARTKATYDQLKSAFVEPNKGKDVKYELEEVVEVEGLTFKDRMLIRMSSSIYLSRRAYVIATIFLLTPIWHYKIRRLERQSHIRVIKKVFV